jgi:hypothetical protein
VCFVVTSSELFRLGQNGAAKGSQRWQGAGIEVQRPTLPRYLVSYASLGD